ncbi:hypothetical protein PFDSM3638_01695 [Pyrococcus furiosus DSM 3638]|uniref:Uncharacterized protein n=2 Tax=Pyrococcus furiosus TaxID=2261 RepID=A0A5C0XQF8_PYRFU|nr:hypothetical protein [Pyrococcus furiosus]AFN03136.1 hypothetical protein PFC_00815 [Pyrococcus furiosus COM1]QEK78064.1 hypothetical protein PFDSM3638_01695 [Pyrococcus furiosus DSM 3638]
MFIKKDNKVELIQGIPHGSHLDTVLGYAERLSEILSMKGEQVGSVVFEKGRIIKKKLKLKIYDVPLGVITFRVVTDEKNVLLTTYPMLEDLVEVEARILKVLEWKEWPEGDIVCEVSNEYGPQITFFAVDYLMKKDEYVRRENAKVGVGLLLYFLKVGVDARKEVQGPGGENIVIDLSEAEVLLPGTLNGGFIDDYIFTGHVKEFREVNVLGKDGYLLKISIEPLGLVPAFVLKERVKGEIEKDAAVYGMGWLQGKVIGAPAGI